MKKINTEPKVVSKDSQNLRDYLNSLSIKEHEKTVSDISSKCFVTRLTVYQWKSGLVKKIKPIYKVIIEEIAGRKIFI